MFLKLFKRRGEYVEAEEYGSIHNKKHLIVIVVIVVAIGLLVFSGGGNKKEKNERNDIKSAVYEFDFEKYTSATELRLTEALSAINGAGAVKVMVSFDTINEKILAKNSKAEKTSDDNENKRAISNEYEENILIYGAEEQPFVLKEKLPAPTGVLVLAGGAKNEKVRLEIYEAVKALYGISPHRIKVAQLTGK